MMQLCILAGAGYDTLTNLKAFDTEEFLDLLEFHQIKTAIEHHEMRKSNG
jgi:hypothetical protein